MDRFHNGHHSGFCSVNSFRGYQSCSSDGAVWSPNTFKDVFNRNVLIIQSNCMGGFVL